MSHDLGILSSKSILLAWADPFTYLSSQSCSESPGSCRPRPLSRLRRSPPFYDCVRGRPFCHIYSNRPQTAQAGFHPFRRSALRTRQPLSTLRLLSRGKTEASIASLTIVSSRVNLVPAMITRMIHPQFRGSSDNRSQCHAPGEQNDEPGFYGHSLHQAE